jgi:hypothetical protein
MIASHRAQNTLRVGGIIASRCSAVSTTGRVRCRAASGSVQVTALFHLGALVDRDAGLR